MTRCLVVLSGGMDSAALLARLLADGRICEALTVDYGQRHAREIRAAADVAAHYGVPHAIARLPGLAAVLSGSSQTDPAVAVPHGHYADPTMRVTVVPNRNMILLAVAAGAAIARGCGAVAYAAHAGDHAIYPDCRPEFADALDVALRLCHYDGGVALERPFLGMSKADIARLGHELGVPFDLTWSCYEGRGVHCGRCGTCVERREAFVLAGVADPTVYSGDAAPLRHGPPGPFALGVAACTD